MSINQRAFEKFEREYLRTQEWTDIDLFTMIGHFATVDSGIASALSLHTADILSSTQEEVDYTYLVGEVYRRTFFDIEHAQKYGTAMIANDPDRLKHFVNYLITQKHISDEGHNNVFPFAPLASH